MGAQRRVRGVAWATLLAAGILTPLTSGRNSSELGDARGIGGHRVLVELESPTTAAEGLRLGTRAGARVEQLRLSRQGATGQTYSAGYVRRAGIQSAARAVDAIAAGLRSKAQSTNVRRAADSLSPKSRADIGLVLRLDDRTVQALRRDRRVRRVRTLPLAAASSAPSGAASPPDPGTPWWPDFLSVRAGQAGPNRFVDQSMRWSAARLGRLQTIRGDNVGYEADFTQDNRDGRIYLGDTVTWSSNLPNKYLDTQFLDSQDFKIRTVGTADALKLRPGVTYWTHIVSEPGETATDTATIKGTVVHRSPPFCYRALCQFDNGDKAPIPSHYFAPNQSFRIPGSAVYKDEPVCTASAPTIVRTESGPVAVHYNPCINLEHGENGRFWGDRSVHPSAGLVSSETVIVQRCDKTNAHCITVSATHTPPTGVKFTSPGQYYKACASATFSDGQKVVFRCTRPVAGG